jgi:4-amino-4-deoxy-L-arabinose transferase-like glycosyltransferase
VLLLVTALFVVAFFSISTEKRDLYVLPAFPAFALLAASLVAGVCGWREGPPPAKEVDRRWVTMGVGTVGAIVGIAGVVGASVAVVGPDLPRLHSLPSSLVILLGGILLVGGATVVALAGRRQALAATVTLAACTAIAYLTLVTLVVPRMEPTKSARSFSLRLKEATADSRARGLPVLVYDISNLPEAFAFYTDGMYTVETRDPAVLSAHLARPEPVFAVVRRSWLADLPPELRQRLRVVESARLSRRDVLLVTSD